MTNSVHSRRTLFLVLGMLILALACTQKERVLREQPVTRQITAEQIAKAYGVDSYDQIDAMRYTWNAEFPGMRISRSWEWEPKTGKVTFEGNDNNGRPVKATYIRAELDKQTDVIKNQVDPNFVNDNYWLLFPFHAYWDASANVQHKGSQQLPLGNGSADLVSVKYPPDGGYTPGDTWDLYVGRDNRIEQFAYHRGGPKKPSLVITTWEDYKHAGPLLVSMDHRGTADGNPVRIFFSGVAVKLSGSESWLSAE